MAINEWSTTPANNASGVTGVNWAEGQAPSTVNDSARAVMADVATWYGQAKLNQYLTSVAGTNTITAAGPAQLASLIAGQEFTLIPANTNTGATTLNITPSGGAALTAKNVFATGAACVGGELVANVPARVMYDGTQFHIIGSGGFLTLGAVASQAQMETATATNVIVTPGRLQNHPGAVKGWCQAGVSANVISSYNVTSLTDGGSGIVTVTWETDMSGTNYGAIATAKAASTGTNFYCPFISDTSFAAGTTRMDVWNGPTGAQAPIDPTHFMIAVLGDQ